MFVCVSLQGSFCHHLTNDVIHLCVCAGLTLGDLIGVINCFFERIGITNVRFKPAYNHYTEPSMEIFGFSPELGKWMEVSLSLVIIFASLFIDFLIFCISLFSPSVCVCVCM